MKKLFLLVGIVCLLSIAAGSLWASEFPFNLTYTINGPSTFRLADADGKTLESGASVEVESSVFSNIGNILLSNGKAGTYACSFASAHAFHVALDDVMANGSISYVLKVLPKGASEATTVTAQNNKASVLLDTSSSDEITLVSMYAKLDASEYETALAGDYTDTVTITYEGA